MQPNRFLGREPALFLGLIQAGITLALTFGLDISIEQVGAILAFCNVALAVLTRSQVVPLSIHNDAVSTALSTTPTNEKEA